MDIGTSGDFSITLSQDGKSIRMAENCASNLLGDFADGMAFSISNWSTYDNWLWGDRCQAQECTMQQAVYHNLTIKTGSGTPHPPTPPTPSQDYTYGDSCGSQADDECNGHCDCRWSWPSSQDWSSPDAHCRCKAYSTSEPNT